MAETYIRSPQKIVATIEKWLAERVQEAGAYGGIVGLSGGIDSAVVAVLLKKVFYNQMLAVIMPCHSIPKDREDAEELIDIFKLPSAVVDLTPTYDRLVRALRQVEENIEPLALSNIKPRLRMTTLYALAQSKGYLVCGASNKAELTIGYFTKHGDSGTDLLPLGDLLKEEVRHTAAYIGIPEKIIQKPPSAGLWKGQTDEKEMGLNYIDIDQYIATGKVGSDIQLQIEKRIRRSQHKRNMPPICLISK